MGALLILSIVLGIIILAAVVYFAYLYLWDKQDPQDYTLLRHYMPQYSNGYVEGIITDILYHKDRTGFVFYPTDVDQYKYHIKNINKKIEPETIWIKNVHIFSFPKGTLSKDRNIIEALAPSSQEYTNTFKQTPLGKSYMEMTEKLNNLELESEVLREASSRRARLLKDWAGGEALSPEMLSKLQKWNEDFVKTVTSGKQGPNMSSIPGIPSRNPNE